MKVLKLAVGLVAAVFAMQVGAGPTGPTGRVAASNSVSASSFTEPRSGPGPTPPFGESGCPQGEGIGKMGRAEVISRALCQDPRTRQTWAQTQVESARLDIAKAAYRPSVSATAEIGRVRGRALFDGDEETSRYSRRTSSAGVDVSWLLFDFGQRDANTLVARRTLLAATASHDASVQAVLLDASNAFYALIAAQDSVTVADEVQRFAQQTLEDALAKTRSKKKSSAARKLPTLSKADELQARTAIAQAVLSRGSAESERLRARGRLAVLLGYPPQHALEIESEESAVPGSEINPSIDELLQRARDSHPSLRAAQTRQDAARASLDAARKAYLPQLAAVGGVRRENDVFGTQRRESNIGLQLTIPLYDGRERNAKQREAEAELRRSAADVREAEQAVAFEVWDAYQVLRAESSAYENATRLVTVARELFMVEQKLYRKGDEDSDMLDLLDAQQSWSEGSLQQLLALSNWRAARLRLAASLGNLGVWGPTSR